MGCLKFWIRERIIRTQKSKVWSLHWNLNDLSIWGYCTVNWVKCRYKHHSLVLGGSGQPKCEPLCHCFVVKFLHSIKSIYYFKATRCPDVLNERRKIELQKKLLQVVLVVQGCKWSRKTPPLLDVQALGYFPVTKVMVFVTSTRSPEYWLPTESKLLIREMQGKVMSRRHESGVRGFKSRCPEMIFSHKISVNVSLYTIILLWNLYVMKVWFV